MQMRGQCSFGLSACTFGLSACSYGFSACFFGLSAWAFGAMALLLGAAACGDSSSSEYGPVLRTADATTICEAACRRFAVCTDVQNPVLGPCVDDCTPNTVSQSETNMCKYTGEQVDDCAKAYEKFDCTSLTVDKSKPAACNWGC